LLKEEEMKLRDHPLMSYKGIRHWPPAWLWRCGHESTFPEGEVGILKEVLSSTAPPSNSCFLIILEIPDYNKGVLFPYCVTDLGAHVTEGKNKTHHHRQTAY
jgi:hypothetical protein